MNRDPKIPDLVSLVEAGDILGMSKQAVQKRAVAGQLPGARVGTAWVFRRSVVEAAKEAGTRAAPGGAEAVDDGADEIAALDGERDGAHTGA